MSQSLDLVTKFNWTNLKNITYSSQIASKMNKFHDLQPIKCSVNKLFAYFTSSHLITAIDITFLVHTTLSLGSRKPDNSDQNNISGIQETNSCLSTIINTHLHYASRDKTFLITGNRVSLQK